MLSIMASAAHKLEVPADLAHSAEMRAAAQTFFKKTGLDDRWISRLILVVDELFMNAVKYGSNAGDNVMIELSQDTNKVIHFAITDGCASNISPEKLRAKIEQHQASHTPEKTSGRGLAIITKSWTDGYEIEKLSDGKLKISFIKSI